MKALVLIGGFGTRLRPLTYTVPKQLIPLAGRPMLYQVLDLLPPEVDEATLATGYMASTIDAFVRKHPYRIPLTTVAEAEPLGTGGGMRNAGESMSDPFLLVNSDVISSVNVREILDLHRARRAFGTMYLAEVEDTRPYGVAALDEHQRITRFVEKPEPSEAPSHWINAGIAVWSREVLEAIPRGRPVSFEREIVPGLLERGIYGYLGRGFWEDAGTPDRLLRAQRLLFEAGRGGSRRLPEGTMGTGPVAVDPSAEVKGASFGPFATVGAGVRLGAGAHVEDSVVLEGATIGRGASVTGSLVGPGAVVPDGVTLTRQILGARAGA